MYTLRLLSFVVGNMENLSTLYYRGIKLLTKLQSAIKVESVIDVFKPAWEEYLLLHYYSFDELTSVENLYFWDKHVCWHT
jgi:hypothetical protein